MVDFSVFVTVAFAIWALPVAALDPIIEEQYPVIPNSCLVKSKPNNNINASLPPLRLVVPVSPVKIIAIDDDYKFLVQSVPAEAIPAVEALPFVDDVETDRVVRPLAIVQQFDAPWGLGPIFARARGAQNYVFEDSVGAGTVAYILDSGTDLNHPDKIHHGSMSGGGEKGDAIETKTSGNVSLIENHN
jgi:hypothetical protein